MKKILIALASLFLLASCGTSNTNSDSNTGTTNSKTTTTQTTPAVDLSKYNQDGPTYGSGTPQLQIFADFQCPACQQHNLMIAPVLEKLADEGKVTLIYRQFPLSFHSNARNDAIAAMCSYDQDKYHDYKNALYNLEISKANAPVLDAERIALAKDLGLDEAAFTTCLTEKKYNDYVTKDIELGNAYKIPGTPSYILNGQHFDFGNFKATTNEELFNEIENFFTQLSEKNA